MRPTQLPTQIIKQFSGIISRYLHKNPAAAFVWAFEALLIVASLELIEGNIGEANSLGVWAFVALATSVAVYAVGVMKVSKSPQPCPTNQKNSRLGVTG